MAKYVAYSGGQKWVLNAGKNDFVIADGSARVTEFNQLEILSFTQTGRNQGSDTVSFSVRINNLKLGTKHRDVFLVPFVKNAEINSFHFTEYVHHNSEGAKQRINTDKRRRRFRKNKGDVPVNLFNQGNIVNYKMTISSDGNSATLQVNNMDLGDFVSSTLRWIEEGKKQKGETSSKPFKQKVYFKLAFYMNGQPSNTFFYVKSFEYQGQELLIDFIL